MSATVYTLDEISKHNTRNDLWVIIHNKVYNVTEFIQEVRGCVEGAQTKVTY